MTDSIYILMLETTTDKCSVALSKNGDYIDQIINQDTYKHSEVLLPYIHKILKQNNIKKNQLSAISINKGPGSYTGLRIGVSTAKGISEGLGIPLLSNNSLEILTHSYLQNKTEKNLICPMVDARRMEVYQCIFKSDMEPLTQIEPKILDDLTYFKKFKQSITFIGDGAEKYAELAKEYPNISIANHTQEAKYQTTISYINYKNKNFENLVNFEPYYLKNFIIGKKKSNKI